MVAETITAIALSKKALEKLVEDIYEEGKEHFNTILKRWKTKTRLTAFSKKAANVRFVKTIWQFEKPVDLLEFYSPTRVTISDRRKTIEDLADIGCDDNLVLQGTAGQGKSIFLRYLTWSELKKGVAFPIFFELRRLQQGTTLLNQLIAEFTALGLDLDEPLFRFLADCGRLVLFLDGFDEIKEEHRANVIFELESLAKQHERLRVVVSARPQSAIQSSPAFRVFQVAPLRGKEYAEVIRRTAHDPKLSDELIERIQVHARHMENLLTTPLMIGLMIIKFKFDLTIPETMAGFFSDLFTILLTRHDKTKPGFIRPRKSGLSDSDLEDCFNAMSFLTSKDEVVAFSRNTLTGYTKDAIKLLGCKCDADDVVRDVLEITCLILEEAGECEFLHKGVQEFHAACFVKQQHDAEGFYRSLLTGWYQWSGVLGFLEAIDRYRFVKWFELPDLRETLGVGKDAPQLDGTISQEAVARILDGANVRIRVTKDRLVGMTNRNRWCGRDSAVWVKVMHICEGDVEIVQEYAISHGGGAKKGEILASELVRGGVLAEKIERAIASFGEREFERLRELEAYVRRKEDVATVLNPY